MVVFHRRVHVTYPKTMGISITLDVVSSRTAGRSLWQLLLACAEAQGSGRNGHNHTLWLILLMAQKSQTTTWDIWKKPCKYWDKLPTSTGAGFPPSTVVRVSVIVIVIVLAILIVTVVVLVIVLAIEYHSDDLFIVATLHHSFDSVHWGRH